MVRDLPEHRRFTADIPYLLWIAQRAVSMYRVQELFLIVEEEEIESTGNFKIGQQGLSDMD